MKQIPCTPAYWMDENGTVYGVGKGVKGEKIPLKQRNGTVNLNIGGKTKAYKVRDLYFRTFKTFMPEG